MFTLEDIKTLERLFAIHTQEMKELFYTKTEIDDKFSRVYDALDFLMKGRTKEEEEAIILRYRMDRTEEWIDKAAPKINIDFQH